MCVECDVCRLDIRPQWFAIYTSYGTAWRDMRLPFAWSDKACGVTQRAESQPYSTGRDSSYYMSVPRPSGTAVVGDIRHVAANQLQYAAAGLQDKYIYQK